MLRCHLSPTCSHSKEWTSAGGCLGRGPVSLFSALLRRSAAARRDHFVRRPCLTWHRIFPLRWPASTHHRQFWSPWLKPHGVLAAVRQQRGSAASEMQNDAQARFSSVESSCSCLARALAIGICCSRFLCATCPPLFSKDVGSVQLGAVGAKYTVCITQYKSYPTRRDQLACMIGCGCDAKKLLVLEEQCLTLIGHGVIFPVCTRPS